MKPSSLPSAQYGVGNRRGRWKLCISTKSPRALQASADRMDQGCKTAISSQQEGNEMSVRLSDTINRAGKLPRVRRLSRIAAAAAAMILVQGTPAAAAITVDDDPILFWNQRILDLGTSLSPLAQTRIYAIMNIAMHDSVNATAGHLNNPYLRGVANSGGDSRAAASQAARDVLVALNAPNAAQYDAALASSLALVADGAAKDAGIETGKAYAAAILAKRASDGATASVPYVPTGAPGNWVPTSPSPPAAPHWGDVDPFLMLSGDQFRAAAPPALDSAEYAAAYNEVKEIGSATSLTRTADQTASALFWDAANGAPWLQIGVLVAENSGMSTLELARSFALLGTGMADALIAGFDGKYEYAFWRPITAIRNGDIDGNAATDVDLTWQSLFAAPNHPSYPSTHSMLSGVGSEILISLFGDDHQFEFAIGGDTRAFTSVSQAAYDGAYSRIWGGIHFSFDSVAGLQGGAAIGQWALNGNTFNAVPEPATWAMLISGFGMIGIMARSRRRVARAAN